MGMYDNVNYEMNCPRCGSKIDDFQTKNLGCNLIQIEIQDLPGKAEFYSQCKKCGLWAEFNFDDPAFREHKRKIAEMFSKKKDGTE